MQTQLPHIGKCVKKSAKNLPCGAGCEGDALRKSALAELRAVRPARANVQRKTIPV
jgi:hypothetical protein